MPNGQQDNDGARAYSDVGSPLESGQGQFAINMAALPPGDYLIDISCITIGTSVRKRPVDDRPGSRPRGGPPTLQGLWNPQSTRLGR